MKLVLQSQASECALACLVMVLDHHGCSTDLLTLRQRFSTGLKGQTLKGLIKQSGLLGLAARPLKLTLENLSQLKLPCILHWDLNHFVVLKKVGRNYAVILDPAVGERTLLSAPIQY